MNANHDMRDVLAVVLAGGAGERLFPLTRHRAKPAVPFGGMYRLIDFTLSNCINSQCHKIMVLVQYKSLSLTRHIRAAWNVVHPELGEFIEVIPAQKRVGDHWYLGTADAIYQNLYAIEPENPNQVLVLSGDHIYKMDYSEMIEFHRSMGADMTIAAIKTPLEEAKRFGVLETDSVGRVLGFEEKPRSPKPLPDHPEAACVSMGIYVFDTEVLKRACQDDAERMTSHDFGQDIIPRLVEHERVFAYNFHEHTNGTAPYWRDVGTIDAYWEAHMDLLRKPASIDLFSPDWPIRTAMPLAPPTQMECERGAVENSLIGHGCKLWDSRLTRSVLSPTVSLDAGTSVDECILMHGVKVGRECRLRRTIIDKFVEIPDGTTIGYDQPTDERLFRVTDSGIVVVERRRRLDPYELVAGI